MGSFLKRRGDIIILLVAICAKLILVYGFFSFDTDMMMQGLAAKNLAEGHGLTIAQVHATDLSRVVYEPEVGWPPAYSLLVAAIYKTSHWPVPVACLVACMAGAVFFVIIFWRILKALQLPEPVFFTLVLFVGFSIPDYLHDSFPTDMTSMAFSLTACYMVMKITSGGAGAAKSPIVLGIITACAAWFRYMYVPVSFAPACFLIWNGIAGKNRQRVRAGFQSLAVNGLLIGVLLAFQHFYTGQVTYIKNFGSGFFPENLLFIYPFPLSSFLNLNFYAVQLSLHSRWGYAEWMNFFRIVGLFIIPVLLTLVVRYLFRRKMIVSARDDGFFMPAACISLVIIAVLGWLSLTVNRFSGPPLYDIWTYVSDRRYYCFVEIVSLIAAASWMFRYAAGKQILLKLLFFCIIGAEIAHGVYITAKYASRRPFVKAELAKPSTLRQPARQIINEQHGKGVQVVFAGAWSTFLGDAWMAGADCLYNYDEVNGKISASKPTLLVLVVAANAINYFQPFITRRDVTRIRQTGEYYFYSCYITPHEGE